MLLPCLTLPSRVLGCVVGAGTGTSCTEAALDACLPGGARFDGPLTFNCDGLATITVTSTKAISADTTIDGDGLITLSGGNSVRVFSVNSGVVLALQSMAVANGNSGFSDGGGIYNSGTVTVTNGTLYNNVVTSGNGGAIYNNGGTVTLTNSSFSGNNGVMSGRGGAIYNNGGTLTVINSTFSGDNVTLGGADQGAGIYNNGGTVTVSNSTFSGNNAFNGGNGGAIYNNGGTFTLTNSTISDNIASAGNGGIHNQSGTVTLTNTIVANNKQYGPNCGGSITDGGHNISDDSSCGFMGTGCAATIGTSFCNTNPALDPTGQTAFNGSAQDNGGPTQTIALCTGTGAPGAGCTGASPAINAGDESVCSMTTGTAPVNNLDQRGFPRPGAGATNCSIGAFEANLVAGSSTPTTSATAMSTDTPTPLSPPVTPTDTPANTDTPPPSITPTAMTAPSNIPTEPPTVTPTDITPSPTPTPTALCPEIPRIGCRTAARSTLLIRIDDNASRNRLVWKWTRGAATTQDDFGNPVTQTRYALCIYDSNGPRVAVDVPPAGTCGARDCWRLIPRRGYRYVDRSGGNDGTTRIVLRGHDLDKAKIVFKSQGQNMPDPMLPYNPPVQVQLVNDGTAVCWEAEFALSDFLQNGSTRFKAKDRN